MVELFIGSEKIDLYEEEKLVIKNSIAKIEDITKVFTSVSETFSVPASENNNKIFKHYYNANVLNSFDARKLVRGYLYLNGFLYREGNIKLNKVTLKSLRPSSYSLDFFGILTDLKELIKDDKLEDLDLSADDYTKDDFSYITNNPEIYPSQNVFASYLLTKRYVYNSDGSGDLNLYNDVNLNDVSYSIRNIAIIKAIEDKYGLTFSRNFFGTKAFTELFMLMRSKPTRQLLQFKYDRVSRGWDADESLYQDTYFDSEFLPSQNVSFYEISIVIGDKSSLPNDHLIELVMYSDNEEIVRLEYDVTKSFTETKVFQADYNTFKNVYFELETNYPIEFFAGVERFFVGQPRTDKQVSANTPSGGQRENSTYNHLVSKNLPDIKIIDYLKGLFQMFKLIVTPTEKGLLVDNLDSFYKRGSVLDLTNYIDVDRIDISTGKLLNQIDYKYKESTTILAKKFKELNNREYGELDLDIVDENGKLIEGSKIDFTLPFQQILYEKLTDQNDGEDRVENLNVVTGTLLNENLEDVDYGVHLHYLHNGGGVYDYNFPSHTLGIEQIETSTTFRNEFSVYNGKSINNNLYTNYHKDYIQRVFNVRKRLFSFTAKNVPLPILMNLKLNDLIKIKNNYFRIDSYDANLKTRDLRLELLLDVDVDLSPKVVVRVDTNTITTDSDLIISDVLIADLNEEYFIEAEVPLYFLYNTSSNSSTFDLGLNTGDFAKVSYTDGLIFEGNVDVNTLIDLSTATLGYTAIEVREDLDMSFLNLSSRDIQSINVTKLLNLDNLIIYSNNLTDLDISNNIGLNYLYCQNNDLTSLDVSNNTQLIVLRCNTNNLTDLDISNNPNINNLNIYNNPITESNLLNIVTNLDDFGLSNGNLDIGLTTTITTAIQTKLDSLTSKGWTIYT